MMDIAFRVELADVGYRARLSEQVDDPNALVGEGETTYQAISSLCEKLHQKIDRTYYIE